MVAKISPYSEPVVSDQLLLTQTIGFCAKLQSFFWFTQQTVEWFGAVDRYSCDEGQVVFTDVLPPASQPSEWRKSVFLCETRRELFPNSKNFGRGELLYFLYHCFLEKFQYLKNSPYENIFLLEKGKVAVVHWLPAYHQWQLHVTDDLSWQIDPGTRIFALL